MLSEINKREWENFVYNILWIQAHYGISKKQMALLLGISIKSLTKIEHGELPPRLSINIVINFYRCFGIPPKDQFGKRLDSEYAKTGEASR